MGFKLMIFIQGMSVPVILKGEASVYAKGKEIIREYGSKNQENTKQCHILYVQQTWRGHSTNCGVFNQDNC